MRVDDRNLTGVAPAQSERAQQTAKSTRNQAVPTVTAATDQPGDRVELSSTLKAFSRAMSALGSERANRVQALAAQYQSGSYHADSAATARGMVSEALLAEGQ